MNIPEDSYEVSVRSDKTFIYFSPALKTPSTREFLQYVDIAPFVDRYGMVDYKLSFDIKSDDISKNNKIYVYFQNGSATKYGGLEQNVYVTTQWSRKELAFTATASTLTETRAMLAFYGTYDTGNKPSVRNVRLELK